MKAECTEHLKELIKWDSALKTRRCDGRKLRERDRERESWMIELEACWRISTVQQCGQSGRDVADEHLRVCAIDCGVSCRG